MWTTYPTPPTSSSTWSGAFAARRPVRRPIMGDPARLAAPVSARVPEKRRQHVLVDLDVAGGPHLLEVRAGQAVGLAAADGLPQLVLLRLERAGVALRPRQDAEKDEAAGDGDRRAGLALGRAEDGRRQLGRGADLGDRTRGPEFRRRLHVGAVASGQ